MSTTAEGPQRKDVIAIAVTRDAEGQAHPHAIHDFDPFPQGTVAMYTLDVGRDAVIAVDKHWPKAERPAGPPAA